MFAYNIFLIGFMGTGKSTIAFRFCEKYAMEIMEMDETIACRERKSIPEIFAENGEAYFRDLETELLKEIKSKTNKIVSCGGGVVLRKENVSLMKENGKVVLLTASPEEILRRVIGDDERPLLKGKKNISDIVSMMEMRREKYEEAADIIVHTDGKQIDEICEEIMKKIENVKERE